MKALHNIVIEAVIFTGCDVWETIFVPRIPLIPSDYSFQFKRRQLPDKVCFTITIVKAHGESLKVVEVDLRNDYIYRRQLYVACPRVSSPDILVNQ